MLGGSLSHVAITERDRGHERNNEVGGDRSRSNIRRGMEALLISEPKKAAVETEEVGMTMEDYIVLADIPTIQLESEEESPGNRRRNQSPSPCRGNRLRADRYHEEMVTYSSRLESDKRGRVRERGRDRQEKCRDAENGRSSRRGSVASFHSQSSDNQSGRHKSSKVKKRAPLQRPQTQGWMSILDAHGRWQKLWFVLGDTSLRYYRDADAEEADDVEGEINLICCINVAECDVEKNHGLQIQTKRALFTLSVMTSRIRRNWVKLLKQAIQNNTHQSDSGSEKDYPLPRRPSPCQPAARFACKDSGYEPTTSTATVTAVDPRQADHHHTVDLDLDLSPSSQREEGEGWDREQAKRLEERNKWFEEGVPFSEMGSRWDSMALKRGSAPGHLNETLDSDVSSKWVEFETLSVCDTIGAQTHQSSPEEAEQPETASQTDVCSPCRNGEQTDKGAALQKEALSLRKQVESLQGERAASGVEVDSPCGPGAPCRARLVAMEEAHRKALQEQQEKHAREIAELQEQRDRLLREESQAAAEAVEAVRAAHREELEREVEKARSLAGGAAHADAPHGGHMPQADASRSELDVLSERYGQRCLELRHGEQSGRGREAELGLKERELQQLRRENQDLKVKLAEEISRMRYFITGLRSDTASLGNAERAASELETLLRAKDNEVQYLKKEISCLQNEVQSLTKEKSAAYERYKEAYVVLSDTRGRGQLKTSSLTEHLKLANAALQEGAGQADQ
uniref:PH domain-containing protein n=3 Tax=Gasterosteus aculeatus TaxID=69293 RepID=G3PU43_GASAC